MDYNKIEVTGIPAHLLKLIDERVSHKGGDRAGYIRDLIEKDIFGVSEGQKQSKVFQGAKRPFDPEQWEADMRALTEQAEKIPILPPEAFARESIYGNHN